MRASLSNQGIKLESNIDWDKLGVASWVATRLEQAVVSGRHSSVVKRVTLKCMALCCGSPAVG